MERQPQPKSSDRAAFVKWFDKVCAFDAGHPLGMHHVCAELAAQAVERAVLAERASELDDYSIPWREAMETAGVSGEQPSVASSPAQRAEPPQFDSSFFGEPARMFTKREWDAEIAAARRAAYADCERAAFVEWFRELIDRENDVTTNRYHAADAVAELAAQAVEKAYAAGWADGHSQVNETGPWRAAMETAGVSGQGDASKPNPIGHPVQAAEPPQPSHDFETGYEDGCYEGRLHGLHAAYADCERIARDLAERADLIGEGEIAHNIVTAIAAKRKEVCGES